MQHGEGRTTAAYRWLTLPGWQNSGPRHWQTLWETEYGAARVEQHDWAHPRRGDWVTRLEDVLQGDERPAVLIAHSLGCILVAAWASLTRSPQRVAGALLVAPGDVEREPIAQALPGWAPIARGKLPFPSRLIASSDDPYCSEPRAREFAASWGSTWVGAGAHGHLNADSGLGNWPEGWREFQRLLAQIEN